METLGTLREDQLILKGDNINENVKKNSTLKPLADIEKKMMNGESGIGEYTYGGVSKHLGYAPIKGTNSITKNLIGAVKYLSVLATGDLSGSVPSKG